MRNSQTYFSMLALALLMLQVSFVSCTGNTYNGDVEGITEKSPTISFGGKTNELTRATGPAAAAALNNSFVVYGFKTTNAGPETVFDHYTVNYSAGSDHTSQSNSAGWEYVGQTLSAVSTLTPDLTQSIKYWDFSATQYDFIAFSKGTATLVNTTPAAGQVQFTPVDNAHLSDAAYTITGAPADLAKVYIADRVTAQKEPASTVPNHLVAYKDAIQFAFKPLAAKVRIGLYEIIPGYSVKDVRFYKAGDKYESTLETTPLLFAGSDAMPSGVGKVTKVTIKFPETDATKKDYNKVQVASIANNLGRDVALKSLSGFVTRENIEGGKDANPGQVFLGRTSSAATTSDYQLVVPTGAGHSLTLKMDYTLLSTDKSQETITVRGATAIIPAEFANWQPNYAYTYLFKISANTNGFTNPDDGDHVGLYPITFDAVVAATEEGMQQTITLMAAPSITTYAKGKRVHEDPSTKLNYYEAGDYNLYICLQPSTLTLTAENTKMYMATTTGPAAIIEATVADVIKTGAHDPAGTYTKDDVTVTTTDAPALTIATSIPADDAPYGTAIPGNFAVFQPSTAGTYVFEYTSDPVQYSYDEYKALTGNESVTQQQYTDLKTANSPLLLKPNKHYKVIVVK